MIEQMIAEHRKNFIAEVKAFASEREINPNSVVHRATGAPFGRFDEWDKGEKNPSPKTMDKVLSHITNQRKKAKSKEIDNGQEVNRKVQN